MATIVARRSPVCADSGKKELELRYNVVKKECHPIDSATGAELEHAVD